MFGEMRRAERKISEEEINRIIEKGEYGILSTISEDGYPYGVPVNYVYINKKIYFHCARGVGKKLDNIRFNSKVCFTVVGETEVMPSKFGTKYESVIIFGTASETKDKYRIMEQLLDKYSAEFKENGKQYIEKAFDAFGVYEISIDHITGKARRS